MPRDIAPQEGAPGEQTEEPLGSAPAFATSIEHVLAELQRASVLLRGQSSEPEAGDEPEEDDTDARASSTDEARRWIRARARASLRAGVPLRLPKLARACQLSAFDVEALLFSLLPELGVDFERAYVKIQNHPARRWPSVDLVLGLLCPSLEARIAARARFLPGAPLIRHAIVELVTEAPELSPALPAHLVKVDPRVASYLFGSDEIDPAVRTFARVVEPASRRDDLVIPADTMNRLIRFAGRREGGPAPIVYLRGPKGSGRRSTAEAVCRALDLELVVVDSRALAARGEEPFSSLVRRCGREAALQGAAVYWDGADALLDRDRPRETSMFLDAITEAHGLVILGGEGLWEPPASVSARGFIRVELPRPSAVEQARLWSAALSSTPSSGVDLDVLTGTYRLGASAIRDTAQSARNLAAFRAPGEPVTQADLVAAARARSSLELVSKGRRISPRSTWDDLVLPPDRAERLQEICAHLRHRGKVMDGWGFDRKLALGKGVSALFSGPPGTGKTMAAEVMATELGLDLYQVDLSAILSKYIGETEQNLSKLFDEAEASNAILFFDEADTLFGKRTQVKDAHDRNANLEASYMLQRMETYEGISILASNFTKNMDEAFVRRIRFIIEFPAPSEEERRRIWERAFPKEAPRSPDLDLDFLARRIDLTGGYIRNIALRAAFQAASRGDVIRMRHVLTAARLEYEKIGKVVEYARFAHPAAREGEGA